MFHEIKSDPILKLLSQEPSTFFKYDFEDSVPWHISIYADGIEIGINRRNTYNSDPWHE